MAQPRQRETKETRGQQLSVGYDHNRGDPTVEAAHKELTEVSVPHRTPAPGLPLVKRAWPAPPPQFVAPSQPQAPEFPTYEHLNAARPELLRVARLSWNQDLT